MVPHTDTISAALGPGRPMRRATVTPSSYSSPFPSPSTSSAAADASWYLQVLGDRLRSGRASLRGGEEGLWVAI